MKELHEIESPLPIDGPDKDCCELVIYDNDGPEGFYRRFRAERSAELVKILLECFTIDKLEGYNFKITNYWKHG